MSKRTSPADVTGTLTQLTSTVGDINAIVLQINGLSAAFVTPVAIEALGGLIGEIELASVGLNLAGGSLPIPSATDQASICTALGTVRFFFLCLLSFLSKTFSIFPFLSPENEKFGVALLTTAYIAKQNIVFDRVHKPRYHPFASAGHPEG